MPADADLTGPKAAPRRRGLRALAFAHPRPAKVTGITWYRGSAGDTTVHRDVAAWLVAGGYALTGHHDGAEFVALTPAGVETAERLGLRGAP